ncbi:hypothetical protein EDD16DRAFT_1649543 [Pisolithus croceorrhizus]|nr:hypothetical protein EDD16DRAFT_1649543 [Pisolithus croceorrhizus]
MDLYLRPVSVKLSKLEHRLRKLEIICCPLLPGEVFSFVLPSKDAAIWPSLFDPLVSDVDGEIERPTRGTSRYSAGFSVRVPGRQAFRHVRVEGFFHIFHYQRLGNAGNQRFR